MASWTDPHGDSLPPGAVTTQNVGTGPGDFVRCFLCGRTLVQGRCPVHEKEEADRG